MTGNHFCVRGETSKYLIQVGNKLFDVSSALGINCREHFKKEHITQMKHMVMGKKDYCITICMTIRIMHHQDFFAIKVHCKTIGKHDDWCQIGVVVFMPVENILMPYQD